MADTTIAPGTTIRQGDVLLERVSDETAAPEGYTEVERDNGRIVLAYGEVTGHAHAISEQWATLFQKADDRLLVLPEEPVMLMHEEHTHPLTSGGAAVTIAPGTWRVIQQREHQPDALPRAVLD